MHSQNVVQSELEGLLKCRFLGHTARAADSTGVGWGLRICSPHKLPGEAGAAAPYGGVRWKFNGLRTTGSEDLCGVLLTVSICHSLRQGTECIPLGSRLSSGLDDHLRDWTRNFLRRLQAMNRSSLLVRKGQVIPKQTQGRARDSQTCLFPLL